MSDEGTKTKRLRGFAAMKAAGRGDEISAIARKGGVAAHVAGTAHEFTPDEAKSAGKKGGLATHAKRAASKPSAAERTAPLFPDDEQAGPLFE